MTENKLIVARIHASIGVENYKVALAAGHHRLTSDEPPSAGGADAGSAPYEFLLSGLAACTAITLRMYAERKQWALHGVEVDLRLTRDGDHEQIERALTLAGDLSEDQRKRLAEIAERTPVTLTLKRGIEIKTELR
jgi:putative redox protein